MLKKFICFTITACVIISMTLLVPMAHAGANTGGKVKRMSFFAYPAMQSITLKWKKKSNVRFYRVYRVDLSSRKDKTPPMSRYKSAGKASGSKNSWIDKKVKKNHYYGYVVRGYKQSKGKNVVLAYDSYMDDDCDYACAGLDRPEILNGGSGEFFTNSKDKLYVYVQRDSGVRPDGVVIYRKAAGGSKYRKIKAKAAEKGRFDQGKAYRDAAVRPGTTYYYKARTYKKYKGKRRYSPYSRPVVIPAVNFTGKYDVQPVTAQGSVKEFVVKMTSRKYNGDLVIRAMTGDASPIYSTDAGSGSHENQMVTITGYSKDGSTWSQIPSGGLRIKAGQKCYLRFAFSSGTGFFGAAQGTFSNVYMDNGVSYDGCGCLGSSEFTIDLISKTARVFFDFD